jgi:hypothetical protein
MIMKTFQSYALRTLEDHGNGRSGGGVDSPCSHNRSAMITSHSRLPGDSRVPTFHADGGFPARFVLVCGHRRRERSGRDALEDAGEPAFWLAQNVEHLLVRHGVPPARQPRDKLLGGEEPVRARRQPTGHAAERPALRDHQTAQ